MKLLSRKASCNSHGQDSLYFLGWQEYEKNPYDEVRNPNGIIQMGLAENQLCFDIMENWIAEKPYAAELKRDGKSILKELALFQDYHGILDFKKAMVEFMSEIRSNKVCFDMRKLVLTAGSTAANETLMFCLAEPGEVFLLPTPYYPGFDRDLKWRTGVEIVPIHCTSSNSFRITKSALDEAYKSAHKQNLRVKGVLVTNPSNPLGTALSRQELNLLLSFISEKNIHLVSDEIYSGTVFSSPNFTSVMEILLDKNYTKDPELWNRVHIVYSLSKDLGLPGFRVGAIYSNDELVVSTATKMSSFGLVSSQTQYLLTCMLSDKKFTKKYLSENQKRLHERQEMMILGLESAGINCLKSNAGLFCWVDMRHLLKYDTFEAEIELWKQIVYDVRLNISPGSSCHCTEPGRFRMCFANMSEDTLSIAMQRIKTFVQALNSKKGNPTSHLFTKKSRSLTKWVFKLSFDDRESDER